MYNDMYTAGGQYSLVTCIALRDSIVYSDLNIAGGQYSVK